MKEKKNVHLQGLVIDELTTCEGLDNYTCGGYVFIQLMYISDFIYIIDVEVMESVQNH